MNTVVVRVAGPINVKETPCHEHMHRRHYCNAERVLFRLTRFIQITGKGVTKHSIPFGESVVREGSAMSEIKVPGNFLRLSELFKRAPKASVSREDEEQRIVDSYLRGLSDETLDRLGYSAEQIDRLRHGKSVRLSA
jgi:hypothetical protein